MKNPRIAVVGATGAVGEAMLECLAQSHMTPASVSLYASKGSKGRTMKCGDKTLTVDVLDDASYAGVDIALLATESRESAEIAPRFVKAGAVVIDNSSYYRLDDNVPLVVPEVNAAALAKHQGIIANPNCTTAILSLALAPLQAAFGLERVIVSTYQAVSGAGRAGLNELRAQMTVWPGLGHVWGSEDPRLIAEKYPRIISAFPHTILGNTIPEIGGFRTDGDGYSGEEDKMWLESRKILGMPNLPLSATCVRVPTFRAHGMSVMVEFAVKAGPHAVRDILARAPGLVVVDDPTNSNPHKRYATALSMSGRYECAVSRIRDTNGVFEYGTAFWMVGDQILKGAALNAVQIAERL